MSERRQVFFHPTDIQIPFMWSMQWITLQPTLTRGWRSMSWQTALASTGAILPVHLKKALDARRRNILWIFALRRRKTLLEKRRYSGQWSSCKSRVWRSAGFFQGIQGKNRKKSERIQGRKEKTCSRMEKKGDYTESEAWSCDIFHEEKRTLCLVRNI